MKTPNRYLSKIGRTGGQKKSERKRIASQNNGKMGGRKPRRAIIETETKSAAD